jgi:hypothetical protein
MRRTSPIALDSAAISLSIAVTGVSPGCASLCPTSSNWYLIETSSWQMWSCSSRETRARSSSCELTTRCASVFSLRSAMRWSLIFSASPAEKIPSAAITATAERPDQRLAHAVEKGAAHARRGRVDVVEIDAGAEHPAPARQRDRVGNLARDLAARRLRPEVALEAAAFRGACDQLANHVGAVAVAHVPQARSDQVGLARVHEVQALHVVHEEVAVVAVVHARQDGLGPAPSRLHRRGRRHTDGRSTSARGPM